MYITSYDKREDVVKQKQACMVCKQNEVHVNYEFEGGNGFCGMACEKKYFNALADSYADSDYGYDYDDMFADRMETDPSDGV